jgi:aminocarboxymuconate-semialdehyde decarboxylase
MTGPQSYPGPAGEQAVDAHAHAVPRGLLDDLASGAETFPNIVIDAHDSTYVMSFAGAPPTRPIARGLTDPRLRESWLREQRIGRQVLSGWLDIFGYALHPDEGAAWSELLTERLAELAGTDHRLTALGTVPLQDPPAAAEALRQQRKRGMPGIMIATRAGDRELDDPAFTPLWEAADETGAVVYLHPGFGGASPRYGPFGLLNGLGRIEDSTVAVARLLYAGVPARYPRMRLVVAHGGGAIPYVLGRLVRNHVISGGGLADPLESFSCLYFDTVVFDTPALRLLLARAGAGKILLGSDYPFPIGDLEPRRVVEETGLSAGEEALILGGTAARLFGDAPAEPAT